MMTNITPSVDTSVDPIVNSEINNKTKPPGSLGMLESLALSVARIQGKTERNLSLNKPQVLVFAGDHGIAENGISIAGSEVTVQMIANFLSGGAAINVFSRLHQCDMMVINSGVKNAISDVESEDVQLLSYSAGKGTQDFSQQAAMSEEQLHQCMAAGESLLEKHIPKACEVIAFGEMGIGNTAAAAAIFALITELQAQDCVGRGTGISDAQFDKKLALVQQGIDRVRKQYTGDIVAENIAREVAGFEIIQMCSTMLAAAKVGKIIIIDGFIVTSAAMLAIQMEPNVKDYMIFAHCSDEQAHQKMLQHLNVKPLLDLGLRLGEGTGAVLALPILKSAIAFYNQMATFESAGVVV